MEKSRQSNKNESLQKKAQTTVDTAIAVLDKLAVKNNNLKLDFQNLTIGDSPLQATINGTITLNVQIPKE